VYRTTGFYVRVRGEKSSIFSYSKLLQSSFYRPFSLLKSHSEIKGILRTLQIFLMLSRNLRLFSLSRS
jgi:hypothetical protein